MHDESCSSSPVTCHLSLFILHFVTLHVVPRHLSLFTLHSSLFTRHSVLAAHSAPLRKLARRRHLRIRSHVQSKTSSLSAPSCGDSRGTRGPAVAKRNRAS